MVEDSSVVLEQAKGAEANSDVKMETDDSDNSNNANVSSAPISESNISKESQESLKLEGNAFFKAGHYAEAMEKYIEACNASVNEMEMVLLLCNRSFTNIRMERFQAAIDDASEALRIDDKCVKGYYRRASAYLAEQHYEQSLADFKTAASLLPSDKGIREKVKLVQKYYRQQKMLEALRCDEDEETTKSLLDSERPDMKFLPSGYKGPIISNVEDISLLFVLECIDMVKKGGRFPRTYVWNILISVGALLKEEPTMLRINLVENEDITIVGDTHGQYFDLAYLLSARGYPSPERKYVFNGDYVDRGNWGVEGFITLALFKIMYPTSIFLLAGNHEVGEINRMFGFFDEVRDKYDSRTYDLFMDVFYCLPIAAVVNDHTFIVHGGLAPSAKDENEPPLCEEIEAIQRGSTQPKGSLMKNLLWSDPDGNPGFVPSPRGDGKSFGPDITARFCKLNGLRRVVRSHQVKNEGFDREHNNQCITIFSAPKYCDTMDNFGSYMILRADGEESIVQFGRDPNAVIPRIDKRRGILGFT